MGRVGLVERLRARREEIAQSLITRVWAVSDPREVGEPDYVRGLREAVAVALDYGLAAIAERARAEPVPGVLVEQARAAARNGVSLDTILRRYVAGHTLLCDYVLVEVERDPSLDDDDLRRALRGQSAQLDRLLTVVTEAYESEVANRQATSEGRRCEQVRRLLAGDLVDATGLDYELEDWHLGVVAGGSCAARAVADLAALLDRRSLVVLASADIAWGWLGGPEPAYFDQVRECSASLLERCDGIAVAVGRPAAGLDGLRSTHRQARAAFPIAFQTKSRLVSYSDVALVATAWEDEVLARSLSQLFLAPLATERDGGASLLKTLRAYLATGRNVVSAAARLGISRQTVASRLRAIEDKLGRPLETCGPEAETALRLWELGHPAALTVMSQYDQKGNPAWHIAGETSGRKG